MVNFWEKIGNIFLSKIKQGTIEVTFSSGQQQTFGNEKHPKASLYIKNSKLFKEIVLYGDIGFAQSYMNGYFETNNLTNLITIAIINSKYLGILNGDKKNKFIKILPYFNRIRHLLRKNSKRNSKKNISEHYDLSNDFFKVFLDDTMMYSSAVFKNGNDDLFKAQKTKNSLLIDKLKIDKNSHVLEIGSGWGSMAIDIVKKCACKVTTVTLSYEQKELCLQRFKEEKVEKSIEIVLKDYRDLDGKFDSIIVVEMFEAVGKEYFDIFFKKCQELLNPSGLLVMQVITIPNYKYYGYSKGTDFIQKYIFPGGHLPSLEKILESTSKNTKLNLLHMEEFTQDYAKTLHIWHENFMKKVSSVKELGFDNYFIRMWKMYLNYCEAGFLTKNINLVQLVFTKN